MILDDFLEFADAASVVQTGTGVANIGNVIDLTTVRDVGEGKPMYLVIQVTTDLAGGSTVHFQLASDSSATLATSGQSIHVRSATYTDTTLDQGEAIVLPIPPMGYGAPIQYERYLGVQMVTATATLTAGAVNAFLTDKPPATQRIKGFADPLPRDPNPV